MQTSEQEPETAYRSKPVLIVDPLRLALFWFWGWSFVPGLVFSSGSGEGKDLGAGLMMVVFFGAALLASPFVIAGLFIRGYRTMAWPQMAVLVSALALFLQAEFELVEGAEPVLLQLLLVAVGVTFVSTPLWCVVWSVRRAIRLCRWLRGRATQSSVGGAA